jgi:hypothetical protein
VKRSALLPIRGNTARQSFPFLVLGESDLHRNALEEVQTEHQLGAVDIAGGMAVH